MEGVPAELTGRGGHNCRWGIYRIKQRLNAT
jgi:hypothetical protein